MTAKQHASRAVRSFGIAIVVTVGVVAAILLAIALDDGGADLSYKTLDYDVQVQSNGDLKITQHIDMKLADRSDDDGDHPWKQLYQQYTLKESNLANITDISVRNATTGETYQQGDIAIPSSYSTGEWNQEHAKQWYIADVSQGDSNPQPFDPAKDGLVADNTDDRSKKIEIGWNIPATPSASRPQQLTVTYSELPGSQPSSVFFRELLAIRNVARLLSPARRATTSVITLPTTVKGVSNMCFSIHPFRCCRRSRRPVRPLTRQAPTKEPAPPSGRAMRSPRT